jgi:hypothetical protein
MKDDWKSWQEVRIQNQRNLAQLGSNAEVSRMGEKEVEA